MSLSDLVDDLETVPEQPRRPPVGRRGTVEAQEGRQGERPDLAGGYAQRAVPLEAPI